MVGTDHSFSDYSAFSEGCILVGARVIDGIESISEVKDRDRRTVDGNGSAGSLCNVFYARNSRKTFIIHAFG